MTGRRPIQPSTPLTPGLQIRFLTGPTMTSILDCTADCYKHIQQHYCKTLGESMPDMGEKPERTSAPIGQNPSAAFVVYPASSAHFPASLDILTY